MVNIAGPVAREVGRKYVSGSLLPKRKKRIIRKKGFGGQIAKAAAKRQLKKSAAEKAAIETAKKTARREKAAKTRARNKAAKARADKAAARERARVEKQAASKAAKDRKGLAVVGGVGAAALAGKGAYDLSKGRSAAAASKSYSVKGGDTLSQIAKRRGTTLKALLAANPQIKDPNKIRIGQKIKMSAPVKGRKSVYQGMSKSAMAGMAMPKRAYGGQIAKAAARKAIKKGTKKFIGAGGKVKKVPQQTKATKGVKEIPVSPATQRKITAAAKKMQEVINTWTRLTGSTGKATGGMQGHGPAEFGTQMLGSGRKAAAKVEQKGGGVVMKKQAGGRMSGVGLSPAEMARAGVMSEAQRRRYMPKAGVIKRGVGGQATKAVVRKAVKKGTKKFIQKGGKIKKVPEGYSGITKKVEPRATYAEGPVKRKRKSKGGEKKPFVRKAGGRINRKGGGQIGTVFVASLYD